MNPDTGAIAPFETEDEAKAAGHTVQLSPSEAALLEHLEAVRRPAALAFARRAQGAIPELTGEAALKLASMSRRERRAELARLKRAARKRPPPRGGV